MFVEQICIIVSNVSNAFMFSSSAKMSAIHQNKLDCNLIKTSLMTRSIFIPVQSSLKGGGSVLGWVYSSFCLLQIFHNLTNFGRGDWVT